MRQQREPIVVPFQGLARKPEPQAVYPKVVGISKYPRIGVSFVQVPPPALSKISSVNRLFVEARWHRKFGHSQGV